MKRLIIDNLRTSFNDEKFILRIDNDVDGGWLYRELRLDGITVEVHQMYERNRRHFMIRNERLLYVSDYALANFTSEGYSIVQLHQDKYDFYVEIPEV